MLNDDHNTALHNEGEVVDAVHVEDIPEGGDDDRDLGVPFCAGEGEVEFPDLIFGIKEGGEDAVFMFPVCLHSNSLVIGWETTVPVYPYYRGVVKNRFSPGKKTAKI
jgi:hypothetical protein